MQTEGRTLPADAIAALGVADDLGDTVGLEIGFSAVVEKIAIALVEDGAVARENAFPGPVEA